MSRTLNTLPGYAAAPRPSSGPWEHLDTLAQTLTAHGDLLLPVGLLLILAAAVRLGADRGSRRASSFMARRR
jgi:hypothetical protein